MVATLVALTDAGAAAAYYEADDYYTGDAKAPSRWHGKGARALGLEGEVDADQFAAMLKGHLPNKVRLGTTRHGATQHKLGWDVTFSAPKSVSVMALVAGDRRLLDAHDRAVQVALDYAERHAADAGGGRIVEQPDTQTRQAILARDFAALSRDDRARTLVLDPPLSDATVV